ncbi:uncharacterized protein LOC116618415 [Nematostella vectensis]|uniref:uncharacterized protein LOC116618415 n=1 Tax=Nematostella vectensis TaxID=45351 RepID=UPI0020770A98|nr:uncharacterized protein LOC116618415 [Nematostella vectensis]
MELKLLSILSFLLAVTLAAGLTCWECGSPESMSMCMKYRKSKECWPWQDRCFKAFVDQMYDGKRIRQYGRGCTSASLCSNKGMEICKGGAGKNLPLDCDVNCCSGDKCNSAALPAFSAVLLVTCTLLFLMV